MNPATENLIRFLKTSGVKADDFGYHAGLPIGNLCERIFNYLNTSIAVQSYFNNPLDFLFDICVHDIALDVIRHSYDWE